MQWLDTLIHGRPVFGEARPRDASSIAALHGMSFQRGWGEPEVEGLMTERNVVTHCARTRTTLAAFIMSRLAADEAEILSVATAARWQGRGVARELLTLHMRKLAGLGTRALFLEVDENNAAAIRLYRRAGFQQVSRRPNYYRAPSGPPAAALVMRRDIG